MDQGSIGPGPGPETSHTCQAADYRGSIYIGTGWQIPQAMQDALTRCETQSNGCVITPCR